MTKLTDFLEGQLKHVEPNYFSCFLHKKPISASLIEISQHPTGQSLQLTNFAQLSRLPQMFIMPPASSSSSAPVASPWATGLERAEAAVRQLGVAVCLGDPIEDIRK